jgi:DNA-binding NarL/FixJ family response regulator
MTASAPPDGALFPQDGGHRLARDVADRRLTPASLHPDATRARSPQWIARGKSALEIASILRIPEKSIEFHFSGVERELQVPNRTRVVVEAMMTGLISVA